MIISVDEEKEAAHFTVPDIEKFGGNLPVVTIVRGNTKIAGNCKTKLSHVTDPEIISYKKFIKKLYIAKQLQMRRLFCVA
jgi:hypothetical protein